MARKTGKALKKKPASSRSKKKVLKSEPLASSADPQLEWSLKLPKRHRREKPTTPPRRLPSAWQLSLTTLKALNQRADLFVGITLIYGILNLILVQGLSSGNSVDNLKHNMTQVFSGHLSSLGSSVGNFVLLVDSAGNSTSPTAGVYQLFLALIASLAIIWALRQVLAGHKIRIRDAYYRGMYPLVPFILVLIVVGIELIPLLIGSLLYTEVINNGIAVHVYEKIIWTLVFAASAWWTLYMLSSSLFALYIVTLPDMTPIKALKSARKLVHYRRLSVARKILYWPIVLLVVAIIIMTPIIFWLTPATPWLLFILTMFLLLAIHSYMYTLYRELLDD